MKRLELVDVLHHLVLVAARVAGQQHPREPGDDGRQAAVPLDDLELDLRHRATRHRGAQAVATTCSYGTGPDKSPT